MVRPLYIRSSCYTLPTIIVPPVPLSSSKHSVNTNIVSFKYGTNFTSDKRFGLVYTESGVWRQVVGIPVNRNIRGLLYVASV
jgi:hypothetical protein